MAEASALGGEGGAAGATAVGFSALGPAELRRWEELCRSGEGDVHTPWPEDESRHLIEAVVAGAVHGDGSLLEPAARAWAQCTSPMPLLVRRLGCLRETFAEVGLLASPESAQRLGPMLDKVTTLATETALAGLEDAALTDPLTGAGNRRAMEAAGRAALASASRTGSPLSVVVIDLDGLKTLNDTRGHAAGDGALASLAARMRSALRDTDQLFRIGGDEFVALLPLAAAASVAELMQRAQRSGAPSFSWGVASAPADGFELAALVHTADSRLYAARRGAGYYGGARTVAPVSAPAPVEDTPAPPRRRRPRTVVAAAVFPVALVIGLALALTSSSGPTQSGTGTGSVPAPGIGSPGAGGAGPHGGSRPPSPGAPTGPSSPGRPAPGGAPGTTAGGSTPSSTTAPPTTTTTAGLLPGVTLPIGSGSSGLPIGTTLPTLPHLP